MIYLAFAVIAITFWVIGAGYGYKLAVRDTKRRWSEAIEGDREAK